MMSDKKYMCPGCGKEVTIEHFACKSGAKGGAAGTGEAKARSSKQAAAAVKARWAKYRESKRVVVPEGFGKLEPENESKEGKE